MLALELELELALELAAELELELELQLELELATPLELALTDPWEMCMFLIAVVLMGDETRFESDLIGDCSSKGFECADEPAAAVAADGCLDAWLAAAAAAAAAARGAILFTIFCRLA